MDKYQIFKGDYIPKSTLNGMQDNADNAIKNRFKLQPGLGVIRSAALPASLDVTETGPASPYMEVNAGLAYDKAGERIYIAALQTIDCFHDENGDATVPAGAGNQRWISIFAHYAVAESDPKIDEGPPATAINYIHADSFTLRVVRGAEVAPPAVRPALHASDILLCDILLTFGDVAIHDADVDYTRREELIGERVRRISDGHVEPDEVQIAADYDTAAHLTATRDYGGEVMELYDRHGRRLPGEVFEFVDDFLGATLSDVWDIAIVGTASNVGSPIPMGGWALVADNGGIATDSVTMTMHRSFLGRQRLAAVFNVQFFDVANDEYSTYFGVMEETDLYLADVGYGFYRKTGNVFARSHDGANFHDVDTGVDSGILVYPHRYEIHVVALDDGTPVRVIYLIDGVQVANITANLPALSGHAVRPRVSVYGEKARTAGREVVVDRIAVVANRTYVP